MWLPSMVCLNHILNRKGWLNLYMLGKMQYWEDYWGKKCLLMGGCWTNGLRWMSSSSFQHPPILTSQEELALRGLNQSFFLHPLIQASIHPIPNTLITSICAPSSSPSIYSSSFLALTHSSIHPSILSSISQSITVSIQWYTTRSTILNAVNYLPTYQLLVYMHEAICLPTKHTNHSH